MPPALRQQVTVFINRNGRVGTVEFFLDDQRLAHQLFDWIVVRNVTDLKARTLNVPRARIVVDFRNRMLAKNSRMTGKSRI